ncbi:hypothetical protein X471_00194 [Bartonella bacilliformis str. Heidi Mejia]|uniref:Flagellar biosynthesis protein, FliO n=2 Tax=Bartonella bacilliformis TaxID=774 RepID=A1UT38_BARBK|nr:flagellar biosynthetic protein FliO [Bartonella bacilliformis]ABM45167.1 conserved hypothetical protein [Bartonella bacilliformis KC583]AMG85930.1 hypothetical protein AL467_04125 [Bartonella bacilliformis]EKS43827.1 hypothetical protein BbINS_04053 [Bartonella bacilliformis INS]EYS89854.1 hypothetical protein X472_00297 [Bartonella bacilliformis San Pedro600-02]EYS91917.1 hypothetical protein X471_00194 [Bartonella bacilliformis str. Heidi Mejia]
MSIWLSNKIGVHAANIITSLAFLIMIIIAIAIVIGLLRYLNKDRKTRSQRLAICDTVAVDRMRRLVLIRRDDVEHLMLIGGTTDIVIESGIINTLHIEHKNHHKPPKDTLSTITEIDQHHTFTEKAPFSLKAMGSAKNNASFSSFDHNLNDSAITATIEGRQEPSLFIPTQKK